MKEKFHDMLLVYCNELLADFYLFDATGGLDVRYEYGSSYVKIILNQRYSPQMTHSFVVHIPNESHSLGTILNARSWDEPNNQILGNIFSPDSYDYVTWRGL